MQTQSPRGTLLKRVFCGNVVDFHGCICVGAISAKLKSSFVEIALLHGCSFVDLLHVFRVSL